MTTVMPDLEGALRTWLRNHPVVGPMINNKNAYFAIPAGDNPPFPLITIGRFGGNPQTGEAPLDDGRIEFAVWAKTKFEASQVERALVAALFDMASEQLDAATVGYGAVVETRLWVPEVESTDARYLVDAIITARAGKLLPA